MKCLGIMHFQLQMWQFRFVTERFMEHVRFTVAPLSPGSLESA
jgi:hypothetical protein